MGVEASGGFLRKSEMKRREIGGFTNRGRSTRDGQKRGGKWKKHKDEGKGSGGSSRGVSHCLQQPS